MNFVKKHIDTIVESLFLLYIYFTSQLPLRDFDIWFHMKAGEIMLRDGTVKLVEQMSYAAQGREWIAFEWLYQVLIYSLSRIGFWILAPFTSLFTVLMLYAFMRILKRFFKVNLVSRLLLAFVFFVSVYEFNTVRPHVLAYSFVVLTIYLIFERIYNGKKWIYFEIPLVLFWTHIHSTAFLAWGLELTFGGIVLFQYFLERKKEKIAIIKDLFFVAFINLLMTLTPPTGIADYRLLWQFFSDQKFLATFIAEWGPISQDITLGLVYYSIMFGLSVGSFLYVTYKEKKFNENMWGLPFILMGVLGFSAVRNIVLGTFGLLLLLAYSLPYLISYTWAYLRPYVFVPIGIIIFGIHLFLLQAKKMEYANQRLYFPVQATQFIKNNLQGKMFNIYEYGGYIAYHVYPGQQIFFDGRAEVFRCCEMRDYLQLSGNKYLSDDEYRIFLEQFFGKHQISYAILSTRKHSVMRKIARVLSADPNWVLVFWDDDSQIFVKKDGKNEEVLLKFGAKAVTPYLKDPYIKGKEELALSEYQRMETVAKSAHTSNTIGYFYMQNGQYEQAKVKFNEAIGLDPTFESPYMNLGELAVKDKDIPLAISYYQKALKRAGDRGLIYIRLGTLVMDYNGDKTEAKKIWEQGVKKTIDDDAKDTLKKLLNNLSPSI